MRGFLGSISFVESSFRLKHRRRSVHLLGYFPHSDPGEEFRRWIISLQATRYARNEKLVEKLQSKGVRISIEEVHARGGRLAGRPHFAAILIEKGYAVSVDHAFAKYLGESGECYISRQEPSLVEGIQRIILAGGLPALAHPSRISPSRSEIEEWVSETRILGLGALEVYHSDHSSKEIPFYEALARYHSLAITGCVPQERLPNNGRQL
jgi:3',5'-nucleoside bisphosphate phosphatase